MSRWFVVVVVALALAPAAAAKVVIRGPELAFACPSAPTVDAVTACIKQHGWTSKIVRTFKRARLLDVNAPADPFQEARDRDPNLALYVQQPNGTWTLGGLYEPGNALYELLDAQEVTIAHTHGYRIDLGTRQVTAVSLDAVTSVAGLELAKHVLYCNGTSYRCTDVVPSCDVVVGDHVYATFHGELKLFDDQLQIAGDGTLAAPLCVGPQQQPLEWQ